MAKNDSDVSSSSLVMVSEGGGWVSDLFYDPNKSLTAITLVSNSSRQENRLVLIHMFSYHCITYS